VADDAPESPYHVQSTPTQLAVQRAVLHVLGHTVPAILYRRAKVLKREGMDVAALLDLADELKKDHGAA
jgi:hypothetical protein